VGRIYGEGYSGTSYKDEASIHFEAETAPRATELSRKYSFIHHTFGNDIL
jgi:hypothetical protein